MKTTEVVLELRILDYVPVPPHVNGKLIVFLSFIICPILYIVYLDGIVVILVGIIGCCLTGQSVTGEELCSLQKRVSWNYDSCGLCHGNFI